MESILVTPENLRAKADRVDEEAGKYFNEYQGLLRDVGTLTTKDYKGDDATAFRQKVEGFEPDFDKMKQLMNEYANFLRQAADNYQNTQENVKGAINGLR